MRSQATTSASHGASSASGSEDASEDDESSASSSSKENIEERSRFLSSSDHTAIRDAIISGYNSSDNPPIRRTLLDTRAPPLDDDAPGMAYHGLSHILRSPLEGRRFPSIHAPTPSRSSTPDRTSTVDRPPPPHFGGRLLPPSRPPLIDHAPSLARAPLVDLAPLEDSKFLSNGPLNDGSLPLDHASASDRPIPSHHPSTLAGSSKLVYDASRSASIAKKHTLDEQGSSACMVVDCTTPLLSPQSPGGASNTAVTSHNPSPSPSDVNPAKRLRRSSSISGSFSRPSHSPRAVTRRRDLRPPVPRVPIPQLLLDENMERSSVPPALAPRVIEVPSDDDQATFSSSEAIVSDLSHPRIPAPEPAIPCSSILPPITPHYDPYDPDHSGPWYIVTCGRRVGVFNDKYVGWTFQRSHAISDAFLAAAAHMH